MAMPVNQVNQALNHAEQAAAIELHHGQQDQQQNQLLQQQLMEQQDHLIAREHAVTLRESRIAQKEWVNKRLEIAIQAEDSVVTRGIAIAGWCAAISYAIHTIVDNRENKEIQCSKSKGLAAWTVFISCLMVPGSWVVGLGVSWLSNKTAPNTGTRLLCILLHNTMSVLLVLPAALLSLVVSTVCANSD
ncbi:hypothetical protein LTR82_002036 [Friedmanniomyces endolithicus]|uniref:Uncharacterized protein n=1 Tax=Friedmanniomyces endolithicus TaxID=329885 RepID=A0AAN6G1K2_9PEZI|nr:hypothetical protein LTR82_002036 [Friedmanniomyces endolithicus]